MCSRALGRSRTSALAGLSSFNWAGVAPGRCRRQSRTFSSESPPVKVSLAWCCFNEQQPDGQRQKASFLREPRLFQSHPFVLREVDHLFRGLWVVFLSFLANILLI